MDCYLFHLLKRFQVCVQDPQHAFGKADVILNRLCALWALEETMAAAVWSCVQKAVCDGPAESAASKGGGIGEATRVGAEGPRYGRQWSSVAARGWFRFRISEELRLIWRVEKALSVFIRDLWWGSLFSFIFFFKCSHGWCKPDNCISFRSLSWKYIFSPQVLFKT